MSLDRIADCLRALDPFRGIADPQLARIAREADRLIARDGQQLTEAGSESEGALVIVMGRAMALPDASRGIEAETIETGTLIGEPALLAEHRHGLTILADGEVRAIRIRREALLAQMRDDPDLAGHFHARLAARLQRVALELRLIDERLAAASEASAAAAEALRKLTA